MPRVCEPISSSELTTSHSLPLNRTSPPLLGLSVHRCTCYPFSPTSQDASKSDFSEGRAMAITHALGKKGGSASLLGHIA